MACVGLPTGLQVNAERPSVVIINRPLQHGRGFINAMEVAHQLEVRWDVGVLETRAGVTACPSSAWVESS